MTLFGKYNVLLAPMAGVSDIAFRTLCLEQGADLAFTEMVSAKGLSYANEKTRNLLALAAGEKSVGVQLFGHEPDTMASQAAWIEDVMGQTLAYLDINMGCPARKIVSKGDGSALMREPDLAASIVRAVKKAVSHPVTVKFRRGWSIGDETAPQFAQRMEDAGADALAVHGRYAEQLYRGSADWDTIARVKDAVRVPVIGNGDVRSGADAVRMRDVTGCDAIMIARAAEGNPWLFSQVKAALAGNSEPCTPTVEQRLRMARRHAQLLSQREGRNIVRMRKHAMWYVAGLPGAACARERINHCSTLSDFDAVFDELLEIAEGSNAERR
ncbi:tRNA dihydrouridine synthase DusB [Adlercreutzia sp. ZJ141]|uniref:tRNA dihydrouridine synthase DusB n=1 Tax=Adlercreutzia sp. ZJ141 TaxID=2709406 RepID=UPI002110E398|nr:tRNA dihydrouridine synthase DusB [Adlercreutzia sp. ZJ141]